MDQAIPQNCRTAQDFNAHYMAVRKRLYGAAVKQPKVILPVARPVPFARVEYEPTRPVIPLSRLRMPEPDWAVIYSAPIGPLPYALQISDGQRLKLIIRSVADEYGIPVTEILSERRSNKVALPRQIAMWRAKRETRWSLPRIGMAFGGRDHTTVLHAIRKVERLILEGKLERPALLWGDE